MKLFDSQFLSKVEILFLLFSFTNLATAYQPHQPHASSPIFLSIQNCGELTLPECTCFIVHFSFVAQNVLIL